MNDEHIKKLNFLKEINKFKDVKRLTFNPNGERESDADHSWHLAMFIITYKNYLIEKKYDYSRLIEIALTHDLGELYAGDFLPYLDKTPKNKHELEEKSARKLFEILPENETNEFLKLFFEYQNLESKEAHLIKALDKLMPLLTDLETMKIGETPSHKVHKITSDMAKKYVGKFVIEDNEVSKDLYELLMTECDELKTFYGQENE